MPVATRAELHDRYLDRAAADLLAHDPRLSGLAVSGRFDGGVAHLTGDVAEHGQLRRVREAIGRLAGVHAVWDQVRVAGRAPAMLDLGCGGSKQYPAAAGIDRRPGPVVSVVADLAAGLPVADGSVDRVFAVHVLEHLDYLPLLDECHRVLAPTGLLHVLAPWWRHVNAVADPTHVRFFDVQTLKYVCQAPWSGLRWYPEHISCDGASVFADLRPLARSAADPDAEHLARFFD